MFQLGHVIPHTAWLSPSPKIRFREALARRFVLTMLSQTETNVQTEQACNVSAFAVSVSGSSLPSLRPSRVWPGCYDQVASWSARARTPLHISSHVHYTQLEHVHAKHAHVTCPGDDSQQKSHGAPSQSCQLVCCQPDRIMCCSSGKKTCCEVYVNSTVASLPLSTSISPGTWPQACLRKAQI